MDEKEKMAAENGAAENEEAKTPVEETVNAEPVEETANAEPAEAAKSAEPVEKEPAKAKKDGKKDDAKKCEKKKNKVRYPFWKRLLIFLLGTTIGFVSCIGAIVGAGFWAYKNLSLNTLSVTLPEALQGTGDVDIRDYTIEALIGDILFYANEDNKGELTIQKLRERYGLNLLADVEAFLPEGLVTLPLGSLGDEGTLDIILGAFDLGTILGLLPEGTLSEPLIDALSGKELGGDTDIGSLFSDVKLGYLLGASYEKQGDEWVLIPANPNQMTIAEYLAELSIGDLLSDEGFDIASLLGGLSVGDLLGYTKKNDGSFTDASGNKVTGLNAILAGTSIGDMLGGNFAIEDLFEGQKIGVLLNYKQNARGEWQDASGNKVTGLNAVIADAALDDLISGELAFESLFEGEKVGVLLNYTQNARGEWQDASGNKVTGLNSILADASLGDLISGELAFESLFEEEKVGTLLNYTQDARGKWRDADGNVVDGLTASIADITMKQFFGDDTLDPAQVFSGVYLGEVMGFTVLSYKADGVTPKEWKDAEGKKVEGFNADVANLKVGALSDGDGVDFGEVFGDSLVGEMQGHRYNATENQWYNEANQPLGTLENVIANMTVGEIIDGEIDFAEAFGEEKVGDLQGYTYADGQWYEDAAKTRPLDTLDNVIAEWSLKDVMDGEVNFEDSFGEEKVGDLQGYTYADGKWYEDAAKTRPLGTFDNVIANWSLKEVMDGEVNFADSFGDEKVGELQGYTYADGQWYEDEAKTRPLGALDNAIAEWLLKDVMDGEIDYKESLEDATVGEILGFKKRGNQWVDEDGNRVTRVLELLAETKLCEMNNTIDGWYLGDLMGFVKQDGAWVDPDGNPDGVVLRFADMKVSELSDTAKVHETINGLKMYEILGYEKKADGNWYHGSDRITGVMAYLADHTVDELGAEVDNMTIANALGYKNDNGVWKDENGAPVSSFMAALADAKVNEIGARVDNLKLSEVFEGTDTGFFSIIGGDTKLMDLDARVDTIFSEGQGAATIGDFMKAGIIQNVDAAGAARLEQCIGANWRNMPVASFINAIINFVISVPF